MRKEILYIVVCPLQGAGIAAMLWWFLSGMGGFLQQMPWPISSIYACAAIGAGIGLIVGAVLAVRRIRHTGQMAALAKDWNFRYEEQSSRDQLTPYLGLNLFAADRFGEATNLMRSSADGIEVELLDYEFVQRGSESDSRYRQTVVLFPDAAQSLPAFELSPRTMTHRVVYQMAGLEGLTFEPGDLTSPADRQSIEAFRSAYFLSPPLNAVLQQRQDQSGNAAAMLAKFDAPIRNLFRLELLKFFAASPGWSVESDGRHLALWRTGRVASAEKRLDLLREAHEVQSALVGASTLPTAGGIVPGELKLDPSQAFAGVFATSIGAFAGFFLGGMLSFGAIAALITIADNAPVFVIVPLFFSGPIGGLIVGGVLAHWWQRRRKRGVSKR
ncbi:MAG TPA: hypothetical protein VMP01_27675 [Pirellulaceae bacterium]|nr:hypothetical protein [Pirellulaceae bacterium]